MLRLHYYYFYYQFNFCWKKQTNYYLKTNYKNYANRPSVILELLVSPTKLFSCVKNNYLNVNLRKDYIVFSTKKPEIVSNYGITLSTSSHEL